MLIKKASPVVSDLPPADEAEGPYLFACFSQSDGREALAEIGELRKKGYRIKYDDGTARKELPDDRIAEDIMGCQSVLAYVSPAAIESRQLYLEIQMALLEEKPLLAVHLRKTVLPPAWKLLLSPNPALLKYGYAGQPETYFEKLLEGLALRRYDVFISYRRRKDDAEARLIRKELKHRGLSVFLDVDDLRTGHFDEALLKRIKETPGFVLILSCGSLRRCADPDDWLRREIACAIANGRTVIPVLMPGFRFPPKADELPEELRPLPQHQGVEYSHGYFDAMIDKIVGFLGARGSRGRSRA